MDPYAPINGISLERYAELSADVSDTQDPNKQADIVALNGVSRADWEAAKAGWTARMQDMSLMGQVATRFMPMYQAALARKSPAPQISFEDYVAMSGCVPVMGIEGMLAHYQVTMAQWTQMAGHWNNVIPTNPQYMQYAILVQQEAGRIRGGGPPKPVNLAGGPAAPGPSAYGVKPAAAYVPAQAHGAYAPAANPFGTPPQQQQWNQQANQVGNEIGSAFNAFGSALGSFVDGAVGGLAVGARVLVQWSDGNKYPGTVAMMQSGQVQVTFPDGQKVWVPQQYVSLS